MAKADMSRSERRPQVVVTVATGRKPQNGGEVQTAHVPCATPAVSVSFTAIAFKQAEQLLTGYRLRQTHTEDGREQGAHRQFQPAPEVPRARITAGLRAALDKSARNSCTPGDDAASGRETRRSQHFSDCTALLIPTRPGDVWPTQKLRINLASFRYVCLLLCFRQKGSAPG